VFVVKRDAIPRDTALTFLELFSVNTTRVAVERSDCNYAESTVNRVLLLVLINKKLFVNCSRKK